MKCKRNKLREGEMTISRARQMAGQQGCGFEANSPAELKQGLALMKRQLRDMEAHRHQYELALQNGFVIAGFGGNLDGIEVPETLMTGEVPAGMTPSQAFDEVLDYMRKVIENLSTKLSDSSTKSFALPRRATKYLESKRLKEDEDDELDESEEAVNTRKRSFKEFVPRGMNELLSQLEEAKKQGIIVDYDMVDPLEAYVFISDPDYATISAVEEIFDTFDKFEVVEDPNWPAPSGCKAFSIARL